MHLSELKNLHVGELVEMANANEVENANRMRKQDLIFALLKNQAKRGESIFGGGTLEVLPDGFGFLRSPDTSYLAGPDDIRGKWKFAAAAQPDNALGIPGAWAGTIAVPHWPLAGLLLIPIARHTLRAATARRRRKAGRCATCGYDLRGATGKCPECGTELPRNRLGGGVRAQEFEGVLIVDAEARQQVGQRVAALDAFLAQVAVLGTGQHGDGRHAELLDHRLQRNRGRVAARSHGKRRHHPECRSKRQAGCRALMPGQSLDHESELRLR